MDYSTGEIFKYTYPGKYVIQGFTRMVVPTGDMPLWDRQRLVADLNAAYQTGCADQAR